MTSYSLSVKFHLLNTCFSRLYFKHLKEVMTIQCKLGIEIILRNYVMPHITSILHI